MNSKDYFSTTDIYRLTGIDRKRIRYYMQLGFLSPVFEHGRMSLFDELAVDRVKTIRALQLKGISLGEIGRMFKTKTEEQKDGILVDLVATMK